MPRSFKRKGLITRQHVEYRGSLHLSGHVRIGGNLTVHGDLRSDQALFCLGRVTVHGRMTANDVFAGCGLEVKGDLEAKRVVVHGNSAAVQNFDEIAEEMISLLPARPRELDSPDFCTDLEVLVDDGTLLDLESDTQEYALQVGGDCSCHGLKSSGPIDVRGTWRASDVDALGLPAHANEIRVTGSLTCGSLQSPNDIQVYDNLYCVEVECRRLEVYGLAEAEHTILTSGPDGLSTGAVQDTYGQIFDTESGRDPLAKTRAEQVTPSLACGSIKAGSVSSFGSIRADTTIECKNYLKAHRSITAGVSIITGREHGILAGIGVPRGQWLTAGFVCAPERPPRILTGTYRKLGRRRASGVLQPMTLPRSPRG
ncbi:hypothetical protein [Ramlibacter sp. AN1133]|uniref:hypothetical protein n=1 Tax=Ramlibacter sp. AN1133 TaxID=3133429 RepID=UPI0030C15304